MKKIIFLAVVATVSFVSCGNKAKSETPAESSPIEVIEDVVTIYTDSVTSLNNDSIVAE